MAKFRYRMQNILNLKYKLEDQQKMVLGAAHRKLNDEEERLVELYNEKEGYASRLRECFAGLLNFNEIKMYQSAYVNIDDRIENQKKAIKRAEKQVEIETEKMSEAMQERKMHEKLREHAFERFKAEVAYEENQAVDELVAYQYGIQGSQAAAERKVDNTHGSR
ncbi:MAG: flagellar export protein FliJ [Catonella sp.]|nr:flagellar export protein FliJ [Catonella sp.]MDY6356181.1 flagellar export protein FliJ [Catonella sp.]